jgi:hypothetical protein
MTLASGTLVGRYEILELVRGGRLSEVYRARDTSIGRSVAVKVLPGSLSADPVWLARFEQEARAAGQIDHPGILSIHDVGVHEGRPYIVSEWLEGETFRQRLAGAGIFWRKAAAYASQIAEGVAAAHEKGIVHRDLKPENLFLTKDGRVKILDLGLARAMSPSFAVPGDGSTTAAATATEPGEILGTVGYMSPEQVRGQPADARSDIFSFGAILYETLAGQRAFQAASPVETMIAILREDPPPVPRTTDSPIGLQRIIHRCLAKNPEDRFQSARDIAHALEDLLAGGGEGGAAGAPPELAAREGPASGIPGGRHRGGEDRFSEDSGFRLTFRDREVPLRAGDTVLGRGRDATIRLHETGVSRHHARITVRDGKATIEDLRSKNGTYVCGQRITSPKQLADGDEIRLGPLQLALRITPPTASTETQREPPG